FSHTTVASYLAFLTTVADEDMCRPTMAILVTDGQPDPWASQGGEELYSRLAKLRKRLGVKVYLVGFGQGAYNNQTAWERMHHIACAAAGADDTFAPCSGSNDYGWDTCADPEDPADGCAWLADDASALAHALRTIIDGVIETEVPAGPPTVAHEFQLSDPDDPSSDPAAVQTTLDAWTEAPAWRGHVTRSGCDDPDPNDPDALAEYCAAATEVALDTDE
ncbi:MAG: VWA domain-containing protein, partial [Myxococcales bacterium]|nr:VWA domain-containing protein [Myxococcales bacterium]